MEANNNEVVTVSDLWNQAVIQEKHLYRLNDNDELIFTTGNGPDVTICRLSADTFHTTIETLQQKFREIKDNISSLQDEWDHTEDKTRLYGKLDKTRDYLLRAKVIGNIGELLKEVDTRISLIQQLFQEHYNIRIALVEKAESLKDHEDFRAANQEFKDLLEAWKQAPAIEKHKLDQLWQRIENARTHFFTRKRQHQEDMEKQLLENLDLKLELVEKAEALSNSTEWKATTETYKALTEQWKGIGRVVSAEKNEELWNRFIGAQNAFFDQKRLHFEQINAEQEENYSKKTAIVEAIEAINTDDCNWRNETDKIAALSEEWKNTGRVPKEHSDSIWQRFQEAKNRFFDAKRKHSEQVRLYQEDNLAKKQALINRIEKIKHSTQWRETTAEISSLMEEWKTIGTVPSKELSNELWEQFIGARNFFLGRKDADRENRKKQFYDRIDNRIEQTRDFLGKLQSELEDDKAKIAEFTESLSQLNTANQKDAELQKHLEHLIASLESKYPQRVQKIQDVEQQLEELLTKKAALIREQQSENTAEG